MEKFRSRFACKFVVVVEMVSTNLLIFIARIDYLQILTIYLLIYILFSQ